MNPRWTGAALLLAALWGTGCETPIADRLLSVEQPGGVLIFLFRDDNLDGSYSAASDGRVVNGLFTLRLRGAAEDEVKTRTDSAGTGLRIVAPGRYTVSIDSTVLGDSLVIVAGGNEFTVAAMDTVRQEVGLAYRIVDPAAARTTAQGSRVWLRGVALNSPGAFGDSTVHVTGGAAAIRTFAVRPASIVAGDSLLFLGRVGALDGQPAIEVASQLIRGTRVTVLPDSLSTANAAAAGAGALDARLARVFDAVIADTATDPAGHRVLTVDDGTGPLRVILSRTQNWAPVNQFAIGAKLQATGVLVPHPASTSVWVLKPRARSDLLVL